MSRKPHSSWQGRTCHIVCFPLCLEKPKFHPVSPSVCSSTSLPMMVGSKKLARSGQTTGIPNWNSRPWVWRRPSQRLSTLKKFWPWNWWRTVVNPWSRFVVQTWYQKYRGWKASIIYFQLHEHTDQKHNSFVLTALLYFSTHTMSHIQRRDGHHLRSVSKQFSPIRPKICFHSKTGESDIVRIGLA